MNDEKIILRLGTYHIILRKDEIPFFDELRKANRKIINHNNLYYIYEAPNFEVARKIDILLSNEDFILAHEHFVLMENIEKNKSKNI